MLVAPRKRGSEATYKALFEARAITGRQIGNADPQPEPSYRLRLTNVGYGATPVVQSCSGDEGEKSGDRASWLSLAAVPLDDRLRFVDAATHVGLLRLASLGG